MLCDTNRIITDSVLDCDLCIVGGGAAGITIANHLKNLPLRIILLEGGGMGREKDAQDLYAGEVVDPASHQPPDQYRERRFGGTTTVWEGRLVPFDPIDFETRDYVPHSGWPFTRERLDPYYATAHQLCEAGALTDDLRRLLPGDKNLQLIDGVVSDDLITDKAYFFSRPTNFARRFADLASAECPQRILLHANCIRIQTDASHGNVTNLSVASVDRRNTFSVRARCYILATGGLEVPRLMLASNVGNERDVVGRYYQSHVVTTIPVRFNPQRRIVWNYQVTTEGVYCQLAMALSPRAQREERIMNHLASLNRPTASDASHGNAVLSAVAIARAVRRRELALVGVHARNLFHNIPESVAFAARYAEARLPHRRKSPLIVQCPSRANRYMLRVDCEQAPNPQSRVTLSDRCVDSLGMPRLKVDWRYTELDERNWRRTIGLISQNLQRSGAGQIEMSSEFEREHRPIALPAHHVGTARMHVDPRQGVVDEDCKVHGMSNLFIAGSAVFPTGSHANPTLTIVALSLRLADHVKEKLA